MKIIMLAAAVAVLAACAPQQQIAATAPTHEQVLARGEYIAAIGGCSDCHTPMGPTGPDMTKQLAGADLSFAPTVPGPWASHAPALAGLPAGYDEAQLSHLLQTGERPNGGPPPTPPMPAFRMHADDADAVAAYIASMPKPAAP